MTKNQISKKPYLIFSLFILGGLMSGFFWWWDDYQTLDNAVTSSLQRPLEADKTSLSVFASTEYMSLEEKSKLKSSELAEVPVAVTSAGASVAEEELTLEELQRILKSDDICAIVKKSMSWELGLALLTQTPEVIATDASTDAFLMAALRDNEAKQLPIGYEKILLFFRALDDAGLIISEQGPKKAVNLSKANEQLESLQKLDPQNGAYPYFRASVLQQLGASSEEVKNEFLKSFQAAHFDTHMGLIYRLLYEKSLQNAVALHVGFETMSKYPFPDYLSPKNILEKLIEEEKDVNFLKLADSFLRRLVEPALRLNGQYADFYWIPLEYAIAKRLITKTEQKLNQGKSVTKLPSNTELYRRWTDTLPELDVVELEQMKQTPATQDCPRRNMDIYLKDLLTHYQKFKNNYEL